MGIGDTRKNLATSPEKVYAEMLKSIETKSWSKFGKALDLLEDLIEAIDKTFHLKLAMLLKASFEQKNVKIAQRNTYRLIFNSAKSLLIETLKPSGVDKKAYCKQAFQELQTLRSTSKYSKVSFSDDFTAALNNTTNASKFNPIIEKIIKRIDVLQQ